MYFYTNIITRNQHKHSEIEIDYDFQFNKFVQIREINREIYILVFYLKASWTYV